MRVKFAGIGTGKSLTKQLHGVIFRVIMRTRDVVVGFIVSVLFIVGILLIVRAKTSKKVQNTPVPTPNYQQIESKFPALPVPSNADRAALTDVSGGAGMGEAWRTYQNGKFTLTIMADLPPYQAGHFYQGWISNGTTYISVGGLGITKGGYLVNFTSAKDLTSYNRVVVTSETKFDNNPETHILEGSF